MKKLLLSFLLLVLMSSGLCGQTINADGNVTIAPLMMAQGFAFQGKEFKTMRVAIINESNDPKAAAATKDAKLAGMLAIGGFEYKLAVVIFEDARLEADLFCKPENSGNGPQEKSKKAELPVPVGHLSLALNQPDPLNTVWLGTLRLKDEKVETVSGEFELYLNDQTPKPDAPEKK